MIESESLSRMVVTASEAEPGLWVADSPEVSISYPEEGHRSLASIEDDSYWFQHRAAALLALLDRHPPAGCLLDVGGGNGYMVRALREQGHDAILIEPGEEGCSAALQRGLAPIACGTTHSLGIQPRSLPSVGLFDVVEHIENDAEFLEHIFELLQPGGRLYLTVPAYGSLWSANDVSAGHFRRYSRKQVARLVESAGFGVLASTYLFRSLVAPLFLLRAAPYRIGLGESWANSTEAHRLPGGIVGTWLTKSLSRELKLIEGGSPVSWGTSVLLAAKKPG